MSNTAEPFDFLSSFTIPGAEITPEPPVTPVEQTTEPNTPTPPPTQDPDSVPPSELVEGDTKKRSTWANLLLYLKEEEKEIPDEIQVPQDLDAKGFLDILKQQAKQRAIQETEDIDTAKNKQIEALMEKGWTREQIERGIEFSERLAFGMNEEEIEREEYLQALAEAEVADEKEELLLIRRALEVAGQMEHLIEARLVQLAGDANKETRQKEVDASRAYVKRVQETERETIKAAALDREEKAKTKRREERQALEHAVDSGLPDVKASLEDLKKLKKAMFDIVGYKKITNLDGSFTEIPVTVEAQAWEKIWADPKKRAAFSYMAIFGIPETINKQVEASKSKFIRAVEEADTIQIKPKDPLAAPVPKSTNNGQSGFYIDF